MEVRFEKILNSRELGGIKVRDGRCVKAGKLFRTALLGEASDSDLEKLERCGIRAVFDFRSSYESGRLPDREIKGAEHIQIEVLSLNSHLYKGMSKAFEGEVSFEEGMAKFALTPAAHMLCDGFYLSFVSDPDSQKAFAKFFRRLLGLEGAPVLWHCSQGKDRTGLAAAFILFALGADRKTVLGDFARSNVTYAQEKEIIKSTVISLGGEADELDCIETLVGVSVRSFTQALDYIDKECGGIDNYLRDKLELSEQDILKLREYYLE